ncbi:hypothetical protein BDM02DRAFT_601447 [Thelephora ganbajun]|uniref:Uncharacterized protein n=1 Tax=Thelephora ganbajun TaxID=370292 RepID=A0ACB6Z6Y7_THEGA|nr:hypothetical protein BDM02DRAFT_601447 [Thelephora ganbajun]
MQIDKLYKVGLGRSHRSRGLCDSFRQRKGPATDNTWTKGSSWHGTTRSSIITECVTVLAMPNGCVFGSRCWDGFLYIRSSGCADFRPTLELLGIPCKRTHIIVLLKHVLTARHSRYFFMLLLFVLFCLQFACRLHMIAAFRCGA